MLATCLPSLYRLTPLALCLPFLTHANVDANEETIERLETVYKRSSITRKY
ncbi:hypothetical protein [Pseudoalteromonas prydzensis]|uniref:hypothetical protein n=1 Tax=Pseudoalteromonas prydzensis TaxID=182141 RepID=UPI0026EFD191|nr:hypothetical protein [Pseudoalteromonas prydzensis]